MNRILKFGAALALAASAGFMSPHPVVAQISAAPQTSAQLGKPFLHPLFTNNMVLQRGVAAPVWGWTSPGQKVHVSLSGTSFKGALSTATANADGKWMTKIGPFKAGGPYTLAISGPQKVTLTNVVFGDVWICSGQSNMRMGMSVIDAPAEIAAANHPNIRLFSVGKTISLAPRETVFGQWDVCTPQTIVDGGKDSWGGFSAVAYFFGRNLHQKLNVPIGLIHTSWGGSLAEAWTDNQSLKTVSDFASVASQLEAQAKEPNGENFELLMTNWWQRNDPGTKANWQDSTPDTEAWKTINLPGKWELSSLPGFDGIVWFRREITIPQEWAGKDLTLHLGAIDDRDTSFFNGAPISSDYDSQKPRVYTVPGTVVKAGRNVIAVRVLDMRGGGGFTGKPDEMKLTVTDGAAISLAGDWSYRVSVPLSQTGRIPLPIANTPNAATVLNNGMLAPLVPFGIKGAIWYQGESNADRGEQYKKLLPAMIKGW